MASLEKLLRKAQQVEVESKSSYTLEVNKMFYLLQAAGAAALCVVQLFYFAPRITESGSSTPQLIMYGSAAFVGLYCLLSLYGAFTAKVIINEEGITIPGVVSIFSMKLPWDNVDRAEITSVITYRSLVSMIIQRIFFSLFANIELRITYRSTPGVEAVDFPVMSRVADRATALRIIQNKLGNRFVVYQEY